MNIIHIARFVRHARQSIFLLAALLNSLPIAGLAQGSPDSPMTQTSLVENWQMEQGLPENIVNAIAQTPEGYLWCGTTRGLARFDGVRFKVFNAATTPELGNGNIRQLLVDRGGALWIAVSGGGLVRFEGGRFSAFTPPPRESVGRTFIRMAQDNSGTLWLTAEDGVLLRFDNGEFTTVSTKWDPAQTNYFHVHLDMRGRPWVATRTGLLSVAGGELKPALIGKPLQYNILCPNRNGGWWIVADGRVRLWNEGRWLADAGPAAWSNRQVDSCIEDRDGNLWAATLGDGVFCFSTNAAARHLTVKEGLGSDLVRSVFEDAEGNIWCGTRAGGLNRVRTALFQTYGRKDGLASDQVTAVCEGADGDLWIGTDGEGLDKMNRGVVTHYGKEQGLDGRHIRALAYDNQGKLWVGAWPGGLSKLESNRFAQAKNFWGAKFAFASLFEDSRGSLWLGQRTLNQMIRLTNGIAAEPIELSNSAPSVDVVAMAEDKAGNLWLGTEASGLFRLRGGQCRRYTSADGLPNNLIRSLFADTNGALWIGTMDGGLSRLKDDRIATCTTSEGLVDNVVNYIADDGLGNFWFSSFRGIFRASKAELNEFADGTRAQVQCIGYGRSDGLPTIECQGGFQPAGCRTRDGRLWFPTIKGLVSIDPAHVNTPSAPPPVLIEEFLVDNAMVAGETNISRATESSKIGALEIPPGKHRFEFHYTGLDFAAPERVRFSTRLEGLDARWSEPSERRAVNYSPLPPGEYRFRVIACNQAGKWNETGATLAFRVMPHFWETWWFSAVSVVLAAGAVAGVAYFLSRRKYRRRLERLEVQLSVEKERARIAQDIHDGVGANLTEIAWLAEMSEQDAVNPDEVRAQSRKISGTARETVRLFDEIVWAVLPENDTLTSLVGYLGRRVDEWFENSPTRCWFSAPRQLPDFVVPADVRHGFYLACKEALHNVNKHAHATQVRVRVTVEENVLRVEIEDNGRGFDRDGVERGNGLRNLRERFEKLGGSFGLQSEPGKGTTILMTIALKPAANASR